MGLLGKIKLKLKYLMESTHRGVIPGGAGGAMPNPPDFGRLVNPISTKGSRLCSPNNTGTPGFSDLPTALTHGVLIHLVLPSSFLFSDQITIWQMA